MKRIHVYFLILPVLFIFLPILSEAYDTDLEKDLQKRLEESSVVVNRAIEKLRSGNSITKEIIELKAKAEDIKASHLLLHERFRIKEEELMNQGEKAKQRHRIMSEGYHKAIEEYLSLIDSLPPEGTISQSQLRNLTVFLDKILHKKKRPILGSLPYRNLNYPSKEPSSDPPIKPAYKGGNKVVSPDDLKSTEEAPISEEIANLAQSLNWNPVSIYEYVKNNIETEWYWGCMKGAEETLRQKSGNDCDHSALFASLLKASGFPSRFVRGTIEFFAGGRNQIPMEKAKNLTGIEDPLKIAEFFQKAGIPYKPIISGGAITNFQIEHIWIESQIPYANYRGAVIDGQGKTWLGLDTSIKVKNYQYNNPIDIFQDMSLSKIRDEYLSVIQTQTPLEYTKTKIENHLTQSHPDKTYNDLLQSKTLPPEVMNILPASMQFDQKKITHEYTEIPDELKHRIKFTASNTNNSELFTITLDTLNISNQKIALSYEPETVEDQEIIDSYGGLDNTPCYLVRLRPVLKVNGERMVVGENGLPMGADYNLTMELISPNGTERITNTHIAGNLSIMGIVAQKTYSPVPLSVRFGRMGEGEGEGEKDAEQILHEEAISYIDRWNQAEEELASLMHLTFTRTIPTVVTIGGVIDVTYLLDIPHGFEWKGVYCDANSRAIEVTPSHSPLTQGGEVERKKTFMQLSALQGSILENRIFEDDFQVESISTAKLFEFANSNQTPVQIINKTNISSILPTLPFDDDIKEDIQNAVNQNLTIRIPQSEMTHEDWTGIGYIKENPDTRESGYMLSGIIAGGMTAQTPEQWANQYLADILGKPYTGEVNKNPMAAAKIVKVTSTDKQYGTVGKELPQQLAVLVLDSKNIPVQGANVTFRVIAGGAKINGAESYQKATGKDGMAKAPLTLGTKTDANPDYRKINSNDEFVTQIGVNLVTASANSSSGTIQMSQPFEEYGKPDVPKEIIKVLGHGNMAMVNGPGGSLVAKVVDQYGNPISNLTIQFKTIKTESRHPDVPLPQQYRNVQFYKPAECNIKYPIYGECTTVEEIKIKAEYIGAIVGTILGNTVNTKYIVQATSIETEILPALFELYTEGYRNRDDYIPPGIYIKYQPLVNENGQPVNASKVGTELKAPLISELFMLYDDYTMEGPYNCGDTQCWRLKPSGIVNVKPITDGTVTYTPVSSGSVTPAENLRNGKYQTRYTTGVTPMENKIEATGIATIAVPEVLFDPMVTNILVPSFSGVPNDQYKPLTAIAITEYRESQLQCGNGTCKLPTRAVPLQSGQQAIFYPGSPSNELRIAGTEQKATYTVYGVLPEVTGTYPVSISIDENGYAAHDTAIKYSVGPTEYNAIIVDIDIYEREPGSTNPDDDTWLYSVPGSVTRGDGTVTIFRGTYFDKNKEYYAQVVLNRGSDVEIRSAKTNISVAGIRIVDDNGKDVREVKFGDGSKAEKRYHVNIASKVLIDFCSSLNGKIRVIKSSGENITTPGSEYYPSEYNLNFTFSEGRCEVRIVDATAGIAKGKFILSNLIKVAFIDNPSPPDLSNIAVLYGGIGNKLEVEINGVKEDIPIEPLGIIVIGIDGLRQDVLYPDKMDGNDFENVNDPYGNYYIDPASLAGLGQILLGNPQEQTSQRYVMLSKVTAIFPSITLASWASIFTGKQSNETGIPGNEFFARDLISYNSTNKTYQWNTTIPSMGNNPPGMITLSDGAFPRSNWEHQALTPLSEKWQDSPQNNLLQTPTLYEELSTNSDFKGYYQSEGAKSEVVVFQHYSRGADEWKTLDWWQIVDFVPSVAYGLDEIPGDKAETWLNDNLLSGVWPLKYRNDKPFPGVFVVYFAGLDHEAHDAGMGGYANFFKETTDDEIKDIVKWLKDYDEFNNKIFIIVADHGMTAMPEFGPVILPDGRIVEPDTSCKLNIKDFDDVDVQDAEKTNNNLHIWELGDFLKTVGEVVEQTTGVELNNRILAPKEIAQLFKDPETGEPLPNGMVEKEEDTTIIGAFNGPMAHIYLKGSEWNTAPDITKIKELAEILRVTLQGAKGGDSPLAIFPPGIAERLGYKIGRLSNSVDEILVRDGGGYKAYKVENSAVVLKDISNYFTDAYIEAEMRIGGMNHEKRSGDIVLIMRDKISDSASERFTNGSACESWHGSLNPSDSYVPLIVAYPGGNKIETEQILKNDTVCKTDYSNCKGNWKLTDIVKEIISGQYQ